MGFNIFTSIHTTSASTFILPLSLFELGRFPCLPINDHMGWPLKPQQLTWEATKMMRKNENCVLSTNLSIYQFKASNCCFFPQKGEKSQKNRVLILHTVVVEEVQTLYLSTSVQGSGKKNAIFSPIFIAIFFSGNGSLYGGTI